MSGATRRTTLGPLSLSNVNSRPSMLGPPMASDKTGRPPRMSMGCAPMSTRKSKSQSRGSSALSTASTSRITDPRNVGEKQFMNASIKQLIEFLARHNYEGPLSPKILSKPANKDFSNIVLFLFTLLDPNYKCTGKFEDEMITMFRFLGYPFTIARSNITAVGSPHAWPVLLAAIMWLIELLKYDEAATKEIRRSEDEVSNVGKITNSASVAEHDPSVSERAFYNYLSRAYGLFLSGKDDQYANLEEQFVGSFENKNDLIRDQMGALETRNQALSNEIEEVRSRSALLPQLQDKKREFQQSHSQFVSLMQELQHHRDQLSEKKQQRSLELDRLLNSVSAAQKEVAVLRDKISHQELSKEDVVNMVSEHDRLQEAQQQASEQRQSLQKRVWELEMNLRDKVKALEDAARMYHGVAEQLKLVPRTARNARGEDLSIDVDIRAKKKEGLLRTDVRHHVLPILQQIRSELNSSTFELRSELMTEKEALEEVAAQQADITDRCDELQARLKRAETTYRREKDMMDQSAELHAKELDAMEARLAILRDTAADEGRVTAAKRRFAEATSLRVARKVEHDRKKNAMMRAIMEVVSQSAGHRENLQQRIGQLKDNFGDRLQYFLTSTASGEENSASKFFSGETWMIEKYGDKSDSSFYRAMSEKLLNTSSIDITSLPLGFHCRFTSQQNEIQPERIDNRLSPSCNLCKDSRSILNESELSPKEIDGSKISESGYSKKSADRSLHFHEIYHNESMFEHDEIELARPNNLAEVNTRNMHDSQVNDSSSPDGKIIDNCATDASTTETIENFPETNGNVNRALRTTFDNCASRL